MNEHNTQELRMPVAMNPYVYGMVNVITGFCRDYNNAKNQLMSDQDDVNSSMVAAAGVEFAYWMCEMLGLDRPGFGDLIERMMVSVNEGQ